jgi:hypothetical protein
MKKTVLTLCSIALTSFAFAQTTEKEISSVKDHYDSEKIAELKEQLLTYERNKNRKIDSIVKNSSQEYKIFQEDGTFLQAYDISPDGQIIYVSIDNVNASNSTRANTLNPNGLLGLSLQGEGMFVGVWDGGPILANHAEFTDGLFDFRSEIGDGSSGNGNSDHGTHVSGTVGAFGSDPDAKGMAPRCTIKSFDWDNDINEVITEAEDNAMLISNHSYGVPVSLPSGEMNIPNWFVGKYTQASRNWDLVANELPYYLMVASAGNEGNYSYGGQLGGGKDKLTGNKTSKNNLVVANAQQATIDGNGDLVSVAINSGSSQGPTDDGRVKPDIAGQGTSVYSSVATNPTAYAILSGTSMSSPNTAGTILLLQEYYFDLNEQYMRSATLKGLVCHTADDAGSVGPDAEFGWGLLNAKKAAQTIQFNNSNSLLEERTLQPAGEYTFNLQADGSEPLKVSITWNDPAAQVADNELNSSDPVLVNDLDLRVNYEDDEFLPYKLNLSNLNGGAIKGDNTVDNIEVIVIENPVPSATYSVTVSHKGLLENPQQYALVATGILDNFDTNSFDDKSIVIYPNPVQDLLHINSKNQINKIQVFDITGRKVMNFETSQTNEDINVSSLSAGTYFVNIQTDAGKLIKKFIKK